MGPGEDVYPRVVPVLTAALGNATEEVGIRKAAAIGLGRSKDPRATRYLLDALENPNWDPPVRPSMMAALAFTCDPAANARLFKELRGGKLQYAAALGLCELSDRRALEPLLEALKNDDDAVRRCAALALGNLKDPRAVEPLKALLKDKGCGVAAYAIRALARIEGPPWSEFDGHSFGAMTEDGEARNKIIGPQ